MEIIKENNLGFYNDQGVLTIPAKQYDTGRKFIFNIINDYDLCDLTGYTVYMRMKKADNTEFQGDECCTIDGSKVIVDTSVGNGDQILSCPGINLCELHLTDINGKSVTTWNFIINVEARVHNCDGILSKDSWDIMYTIETKAPIESPELTGIPKAPTAPMGTNTTQIATTAFVQTAVSEGISASDALIFKGTLGTTGTITALPTTYKTGWTYRVVTNDTYAGQVCEIGDLVIALVDREDTGNLDSDWCVAQTNIDGAITGIKGDNAYIEVSQTCSVVTIKHNDVTRTDTTSTTNLSHGDTFTAVKSITSDDKGHITEVDTETVALPTYKAGDNITFTPNTDNDEMVISSSHESITTSADTTSTASPNAGETFTTVDSVIRDSNGHVTKVNTKTVTLPNTSVTVDDSLSNISENPVQNKVINNALETKADNIYYDEDTDELQLRYGTKVLSIATIKGGGGGGGILLAQPTSVSLTNTDESVVIKWTDPSDLTLNGATLAKWVGTLVVRKVGSAPTSKADGVIVVDSKTRDAYTTAGFTDTGLVNDMEYFYGIFPYTTDGAYTYDYTTSITPTAIYPTAPSGVSVSSGNAEITVTFTKPSDATGIRIVYGTTSPESETDGTIIDTTASPYTITGLTNGTTYYIRVYSYNAKGRFTASDAVSATPKALELVSWSTGTDAQIKAIVDAYYNGDATLEQIKSVWTAGDSRSISLSAMSATGVGESHTAQTVQLTIIGFNHDDLTTPVNGKTKSLFTVQLKNCLNEKGYMNDSNTNSGGWEGSKRRTWCNNTFKNALPSTIKGLVKSVNKKNYKVYNSTTITTTSDHCFLLSETELFGAKTCSPGTGEGIQYDYYKTSSNRIKQVNGSNSWWWERSPDSGDSYCFCNVYSNGNADYDRADTDGGVAPAFCM